jgi:hypothetical protein
MEATLKMPAAYAVMDCEEMTYTDGGATTLQAICSWFVPFYGWYKGITAVRDYRKAHPDDWLDTGLSALSADMEKSTANLFYDVGNAISVVSVSGTGIGLLVNALIVFA